jgi:hypothetical protein
MRRAPTPVRRGKKAGSNLDTATHPPFPGQYGDCRLQFVQQITLEKLVIICDNCITVLFPRSRPPCYGLNCPMVIGLGGFAEQDPSTN